MTPPPKLLRVCSDRKVNVFDLQPQDICIEDIAHALGNQCRYGGHTKFHYSVAQHSVYVAVTVLDISKDVKRALVALLHDASEAYLTDLPRPLKDQPIFNFYRDLERQVQRRVMQAFNLPHEEDELVKKIDNEILTYECQQLFNPGFFPEGFGCVAEPNWDIPLIVTPYTPLRATRQFLHLYNTLQERLSS